MGFDSIPPSPPPRPKTEFEIKLREEAKNLETQREEKIRSFIKEIEKECSEFIAEPKCVISLIIDQNGELVSLKFNNFHCREEKELLNCAENYLKSREINLGKIINVPGSRGRPSKRQYNFLVLND